jgi:restriction endonuclease S subunit
MAILKNKFKYGVVVSLGDVATLDSGYSFRGKIEGTSPENLPVVQMKDLTDDNRVSLEKAVHVYHELYDEKFMLRQGDLVFRSRGRVPEVALVEEAIEEALLVAPLIRIRPGGEILPEYLRWVINREASQNFLKAHMRGTGSKMINKQSLSELPIDLPPLAMQKKIVAVVNAAWREQKLLKQIADKRGKFNDDWLMRLVQGSL